MSFTQHGLAQVHGYYFCLRYRMLFLLTVLWLRVTCQMFDAIFADVAFLLLRRQMRYRRARALLR